MEEYSDKLSRFFDSLTFAGSILVILFWSVGSPLFYTPDGPVMSIFTAISLLLLSGIRLARRYLLRWPVTLSLAVLVITGGGNMSSIMMMTAAPGVLARTSSPIVMTSVFTSLGILFFCTYELLVYLRNTPKNVFILDDILIHLALVPGELSLLGHIFNNPTYLSMGIDPRVGISILEMGFMASFAASTILSNHNLFLWQFLKGGLSNQIIFLSLFSNQYIAPVIYLLWAGKGEGNGSFGLELFIMLAGVFATLAFLIIQAYNQNSNLSLSETESRDK
ncbi:MAG: hypothetical protein KDK54_01960 [Leptospiraceae bacterium]|nr:hypothetical protein [Leptospiraceae bacterium]